MNRNGFNDTAEFGMVYSESNNNSKSNTKIENKKVIQKVVPDKIINFDGYE